MWEGLGGDQKVVVVPSRAPWIALSFNQTSARMYSDLSRARWVWLDSAAAWLQKSVLMGGGGPDPM